MCKIQRPLRLSVRSFEGSHLNTKSRFLYPFLEPEPGFKIRIQWLTEKPGLQKEDPDTTMASVQGMILPSLSPKNPRQLVQETVHLRKENSNTLKTVDKAFQWTVTPGYSKTASKDWSTQNYSMLRSLCQTRENSEGPPGSRAPHGVGWGLLWDGTASSHSLTNSTSSFPSMGVDCKNTSYWVSCKLIFSTSSPKLTHLPHRWVWAMALSSICSTRPALPTVSSSVRCSLNHVTQAPCSLSSQGRPTGD